MNSKLHELYKETLLRHSRNRANQRELSAPTHSHTARNPLCGDEVTVSLKVTDSLIGEIAFQSQCCSICAASASMLGETLKEQTTESATRSAHSLLEALLHSEEDAASLPGDLQALNGVRAFPSRIRCATLPWEALLAALGSAAKSKDAKRL